jgi:cytochrome c553
MNRLLLGLTFAALAASANAADVEAGKKKATEVCAACHGPDGNSQSADFPRVAGQHADYLRKAMRDYKSGARKDPVMAGFANQLSAQDIENVAAFFAAQKGLQHKY